MSDTEAFGPALPPGFKKTTDQSSTTEDNTSSTKVTGPVLPSSSSKIDVNSETEDSDSSSSESESEQQHSKVIGPAKPKDYQLMQAAELGAQEEAGIGPALPPGFVPRRDDDDDSIEEGIGPRPPVPGQQDQGPSAAEEFEERARKMKQKLIHGADDSIKPVERESWMTELPSIGITKHMGLVARKLGDGCKVKDEDQSIWTDTPADRERKAKDGHESRGTKRKHGEKVLSSRDRQMAEQVEHYNKEKRAESLLKMHEKKIKKKNKEKKKKEKKKKKGKKEKEVKERRPFDRDSDLNVHRFDNAQKKLLIKRSQELNSRFGHGGQQFL